MVYRPSDLPIGVFDSGVGGLTVLRALRETLPGESFVYLGDTARLPYGTKSRHTVARYAMQATQVLVDRGVKLLVIACNTASAVAVDELRAHFRPLPVLGVVEPGAEAAASASQRGHVLVIGTESTIRGGAYERAIAARRPDATVHGQACPLFVSLAEEGWVDGDVPHLVAERYLGPWLQRNHFVGRQWALDCLVLGCTHFPVLGDVIRGVVGDGVRIVDSAQTTAAAATRILADTDLAASGAARGVVRFLATDDAERFARVGSRFLDTPLLADSVELVDL
jgi:glutamate racemase